MALSDYMPYGAPELLDGASPRLARATFTASGLVAAVVLSAGLLLASRPGSPQPPICMPPIDEHTLGQFTILVPQPAAGPPGVRIVDASEFRPVDTVPPAIAPIDEPPAIGPESVAHIGEPEAASGGGGSAPIVDRDPRPDEFVYTDQLPQLVRGVKPVYPDLARDAGVEGTVRLQLLVGLDGHVQRAIVRPGGSVPMLDEAAIAAALATVFTPALSNNQPVKVWVAQDYVFKLH